MQTDDTDAGVRFWKMPRGKAHSALLAMQHQQRTTELRKRPSHIAWESEELSYSQPHSADDYACIDEMGRMRTPLTRVQRWRTKVQRVIDWTAGLMHQAWKHRREIANVTSFIIVATLLVVLLLMGIYQTVEVVAGFVVNNFEDAKESEEEAATRRHMAHHPGQTEFVESLAELTFDPLEDVAGAKRVFDLHSKGSFSHVPCRPLEASEIERGLVLVTDGEDPEHEYVRIDDIIAANEAILRDEMGLSVMLPKYWRYASSTTDPKAKNPDTIQAVRNFHFNPCVITIRTESDTDFFGTVINPVVTNWIFEAPLADGEDRIADKRRVTVAHESDELFPDATFSMDQYLEPIVRFWRAPIGDESWSSVSYERVDFMDTRAAKDMQYAILVAGNMNDITFVRQGDPFSLGAPPAQLELGG